MEQLTYDKNMAETSNYNFGEAVYRFLFEWASHNANESLLRFDQPLDEYLENDALRDFFLNTSHPLQKLLKDKVIARHLGRSVEEVYFDPATGDPLFGRIEQRIYNLARRLTSESMHIPFRSIHPNKQTEAGDIAELSTYTVNPEELRYNSGNHFSSRPANVNVFDENSRRCVAKAEDNLHVMFRRGFLEDRLQDVKEHTAMMHAGGETRLQFFVIYSRHSPTEGHFGTSLVIMNPARPDFPQRVLVCDTLLKELPQHPRWWHHFIAEYSHVFGEAIAEIVEDLSHPLQKVNVKGDHPYRHDWDCPYYAASMADALAELVKMQPNLAVTGSAAEIHNAMKVLMPEYYFNQELKDRDGIREANRLKRWHSGLDMISALATEVSRRSSYEV